MKRFFAWLWRTVDKIIFAVLLIIGLQIPNFLIQYQQRLGGHLDEAKRNVASYEPMAEQLLGSADVRELASRFIASADEKDRLFANKIAGDMDRMVHLDGLLTALKESNPVSRMAYALFQLEPPIARQTLTDFKLGIPLTLEAIIYGLILAIVITGFYRLFFSWILGLSKRSQERIKPNLAIGGDPLSPKKTFSNEPMGARASPTHQDSSKEI
ncbi:MAG: DUF2937 family protein [Deinococcales bacterium]